jgi:hypothetical protein
MYGFGHCGERFCEVGCSLAGAEYLGFEALVLAADPDCFFVCVAGFFQLGPELFLAFLLGLDRLAAPVLVHHLGAPVSAEVWV